MKIAICTPCYADMKALFVVSLMGLTTDLARHGHQYQFLVAQGSSRIDLARSNLAERALATGADWVIWLDVDMTFPADAARRLIAHGKQMVGCAYRRRVGDQATTAQGEGTGDLLAAERLGFGVLAMKADVLRAVPRPWFVMAGDVGEDYYFCQQAKAHGIQPYVDRALSMEVGHIAETVLTFSQ